MPGTLSTSPAGLAGIPTAQALCPAFSCPADVKPPWKASALVSLRAQQGSWTCEARGRLWLIPVSLRQPQGKGTIPLACQRASRCHELLWPVPVLWGAEAPACPRAQKSRDFTSFSVENKPFAASVFQTGWWCGPCGIRVLENACVYALIGYHGKNQNRWFPWRLS